MTWSLSRFRAGELVEVRSQEEILATLDQRGCLDGLPFMPEMLQYCGKRFQVAAVAHKACDMVRQPGTARRLHRSVHLMGLRCDGSAHDGCEAECNLFWRDEWLKPTGDRERGRDRSTTADKAGGGCTAAQLAASTRVVAGEADGDPCYSCQATQLYDATEPLAWWDVRQYVFDVATGNHTLRRVLRVIFLFSLRWLLPRIPVGYSRFKKYHDRMHDRLAGRAAPSWNGQIRGGMKTPTGRLDLKVGEYVRIKSQTEIEKTVNEESKNRGLFFDPDEMATYCGRTVKVKKIVTKIIEERAGPRAGKMLQMKEPCIMLEGVVCKSEFVSCRLNCPRAIPSYWREIWLERAEQDDANQKRAN